MKTLVTLDISDEQRNNLACLLAGKHVKRMATREEIRDFVNGAIARLNEVKADLERGVTPLPSPTVSVHHGVEARSAKEAEQVEKLRAEGRSDGYIIGWLKVGRKTPFIRQGPAVAVEISIESEEPSP